MDDLMSYPILAICGWSNSGKTTVVEQVVAWFRRQGLSVMVAKHTDHGIDLDGRGKDTDRLFRAGADVLIQGLEQTLVRSHHHNQADLIETIPELVERYDFILFEGFKQTELPKVWLLASEKDQVPADLRNCLAILGPAEDRLSDILVLVKQRLHERQSRRPPDE